MQVDEHTAAVLDALLPQVPFDGWTRSALERALASLGQPPEDAVLLFPGGAGDMIEAFFALADARMVEAARDAGLEELRTPARVRTVLALWYAQNHGNREAVRRALSWLSIPSQALRAARITAGTVDSVWFAAGDKSADFSWYTKRGILAAVFVSTTLFWLGDTSEESEATQAFLDRRLAGVGRFGKFRKQAEARLRGCIPGAAA